MDCIFSGETNSPTIFMPYRLPKNTMISEPMILPTEHHKSPYHTPNVHPAAISSASPGISFTTVWTTRKKIKPK